MVSRPSAARVGPASGKVMMSGARKIVFSVFAQVVVSCSANREVTHVKSLMVMEAE